MHYPTLLSTRSICYPSIATEKIAKFAAKTCLCKHLGACSYTPKSLASKLRRLCSMFSHTRCHQTGAEFRQPLERTCDVVNTCLWPKLPVNERNWLFTMTPKPKLGLSWFSATSAKSIQFFGDFLCFQLTFFRSETAKNGWNAETPNPKLFFHRNLPRYAVLPFITFECFD